MFYEGMNFAFFDFETTGINANGQDDDLPIELGIILTDENLLFKDHYQTYIKWEWMSQHEKWPERYLDAYKVHNIELETIKKFGKLSEIIIVEIEEFLNKNIKDTKKQKTTLVSDNAYFDTLMMHKVFNNALCAHEFYNTFHYTTWDINMLYTAAGVKKAT